MSAAIEDQSAREVYCRFVWAENLIGADPHTVKTESVKGAGSYEWKATFKFKLRSGLSQKHFERSAGQLELVARSKSGWGPWAEEVETKVAVGEFRLKNPKGANPLLSTALWQRGVTLTQPGSVPEFGSFAIQMKLRQPFTDAAPPMAAAAVPAPAKAAAASPASLPEMEAEHEDPNAFANRLVSIEVVNHEIERFKKAVGVNPRNADVVEALEFRKEMIVDDVECGILTLPQYLDGLRAAIAADEIRCKDKGDKVAGTHIVIMTKELNEAVANL